MQSVTDRECGTLISALRFAIERRRGDIADDIARNTEAYNDIARFEKLLKKLERESGRATEPDFAKARI